MMKILSAVLLGSTSVAACLIENQGAKSVVEISLVNVNGVHEVKHSALSVDEYSKLEPLEFNDPLNVDMTISAMVDNMRFAFDSIFTNLP